MHLNESLNWSAIDTVLLDMDGTLLDLHFDSFFWLEHLPVRYSQIHRSNFNSSKNYLLSELSKNRGTIEWYSVDYWSEKLKVDIKSLREEVAHNVAYRPFAEEFLALLQKSTQRVVLVTNDHHTGLEMKCKLTGLDQYMDALVVSHDFNVAKEEQSFWIQMQEVEPFDPTRTLFVDDTVAVLDSAQTYGIKHLRCINQPNTKEQRDICEKFIGIDCFSTLNQQLKFID